MCARVCLALDKTSVLKCFVNFLTYIMKVYRIIVFFLIEFSRICKICRMLFLVILKMKITKGSNLKFYRLSRFNKKKANIMNNNSVCIQYLKPPIQCWKWRSICRNWILHKFYTLLQNMSMCSILFTCYMQTLPFSENTKHLLSKRGLKIKFHIKLEKHYKKIFKRLTK